MRPPRQQVALHAPLSLPLNSLFQQRRVTVGGGLFLGVAILKPDPRCKRVTPQEVGVLTSRRVRENSGALCVSFRSGLGGGGGAEDVDRGTPRAGRQAGRWAAPGRAGSWARSEPAVRGGD